MTSTIIWTVVILTALGLLLALILFWVAKKFKVEEDPRIDEIEKGMPAPTAAAAALPVAEPLPTLPSRPPISTNSSAPSGATR